MCCQCRRQSPRSTGECLATGLVPAGSAVDVDSADAIQLDPLAPLYKPLGFAATDSANEPLCLDSLSTPSPPPTVVAAEEGSARVQTLADASEPTSIDLDDICRAQATNDDC